MAQEGEKRSQSCRVVLDYKSVDESLKQTAFSGSCPIALHTTNPGFNLQALTPKTPKYIFQTIK